MSQRRRYRKSMIWLSLLATIGGILALGSCSSPIPNRNPIGESFPVVRGESLKGDAVELPSAVSGEPAILMVGYVQGTQFDLDRWTLGFAQAEAKIRVVEVPAVVGWFPDTFLQGTIDNGMRAGIPAEDWEAVVTLYGSDATRIQRLTGNQNPRNGRILLLDDRGVIRWFWDQGYSSTRLLELLKLATGLPPATAGEENQRPESSPTP
jgi:hypothetical protein